MVLPGWLRSLKPMFSIVWKGLNPKTSTIQYYLHQLLQNPVDLYQLWSRALFKYKVWLILVGQLHTSYIVKISWFSRGMFSTSLSVINGSGIPLVKVKQTFSIFTFFFSIFFVHLMKFLSPESSLALTAFLLHTLWNSNVSHIVIFY